MSTQHVTRDGRITIQGVDGKMQGSVTVDTPIAPTVAIAAPVASTGKQGTDAPPLVVEFPSKNGRGTGGRYYVRHPDHKAQALELGVDEALAQKIIYPSITTCIGGLAKDALVPWAAGITADAAEERLLELQQMAPTDMAEALDMLLEPRPGDRNGRSNFNVEMRAAHKLQRDTAAARGTEVHAICEALVHGEITVDDVPDEYLGYVEAYQAFRDDYPGMKFVATEITVAGDGYMGTTDGIVEYNGKRYTLDWKTNAKATVYSSVGMQLAAAANGDMIVHADGTTAPMPKIDGGLAVGMNDQGKYQVFLFETDRGGSNHEGFKSSINAWHWKFKSGKDPKALKPGVL